MSIPETNRMRLPHVRALLLPWSGVLLALLICWGLVWFHFEQRKPRTEIQAAMRGMLRYRRDLARSLLYLGMGEEVGGSFSRRGFGLALAREAEHSLDEAIRHLAHAAPGGLGSEIEEMRRLAHETGRMRDRWAGVETHTDGRLDRHADYRRLDIRAELLEVRLLAGLNAMMRRQDRMFLAVFGSAVLLLVAVGLRLYRISLARVQAERELERHQVHLEELVAERSAALAENYARLKKTEEMRDNLVHMLVHDLRSPLMGVSGYLQLAQHAGAAGGQDFLKKSREAFDHLTGMINTLLDVSRLEAGSMKLERKAADLRVVLREALTSLGALVNACRVEAESAPEPVEAWCDAAVVARVLANLVGNALKFAPRGSRIGIRLESLPESVRVWVEDEGPGIPPEDRGRIFEKFGQVALHHDRKTYSTGLGLTFCKLAVEAHGGRIGVESREPVGSRFWFTLPRREG